MPVRRLEPDVSAEHNTLVHILEGEWSSPADNSSEPLILEEYDRSGGLSQVYVVWSKWEGIDRSERAEVIMDAAEKRFGLANAAKIIAVIGLEPDEAKRMGLKV